MFCIIILLIFATEHLKLETLKKLFAALALVITFAFISPVDAQDKNFDAPISADCHKEIRWYIGWHGIAPVYIEYIVEVCD